MLKIQKRPAKQERPQTHTSIHYFEPQMIKSSIEIKNTIQLSPSLSLPKKENHDHSNITAARSKEEQKYQEGVSLRDKINSKLQKDTKNKRNASIFEVRADTKKIIPTQRQAKECLSSIRKMLTQQSPPCTSRNQQTKRLQKKNRETQRQQFQQRQLQMILQKKQKQQAAQAQKLQRQIRQCTFKPRLTVYKKR